MDYIILDMEWDTAYCHSAGKFVNQIIQIGAVRLDSDFKIVDTFEETVRSSVSKKVSSRFAELTGITTEKMLSGIPLNQAVERYNAWIGDGNVTMTWSNSDLFSIMENERYLLKGVRFKMDKYLDLQKFIQNEMRLAGKEINSQISLANAAAELGITTEEYSLHTAKDDSLVCAACLKKCYNKERFEALIKDTSNPEFYKRLFFKPYYIDDIKSEHIDRSELNFCCDRCGSKAEKLTPWKYSNRWFSAKFRCKSCKRRFVGKLSFKKTYDSIKVKRRVCEPKPKVRLTGEKVNEMQSVPEKV